MPRPQEQPADRTGLRRANLALLLRLLREHQGQSRAQLAVLSGLSKATVSSLVAELELRRLVRLGGVATGGHGRPGQLVELSEDGVCGIGMEVGVDHIGVTILGLTGRLIQHRRVPCDVLAAGVEGTLDELALAAGAALDTVHDHGAWPAGITVGVPGLVDITAGIVRLSPRLRWREVALADELAGRVGIPLARVLVDNDANLSATAEYEVGGRRGSSDLVYVTGDFGVGAGVISGGRLVRGAIGFAGEVGHMPMDPMGPYCSCGRRGCWETQVGISALLHALRAGPGDDGGADPVANPGLDLDTRVATIRSRAELGDARTLGVLNQIGAKLGHGVSILVNVLNPAVVVLGGYFAALHDWLVEPARTAVAARALVTSAGAATVVGSELGFTAATTGGAHAALGRVFGDPTVVPVRDESREAPA